MMTNWRTARSCGANGTCVEVGSTSGAVLIRDTKQRGRGPILQLTRQDARILFDRIKAL